MTDANLNKKHLKATNASKCFKPSLNNIFKKCLILIIMNVTHATYGQYFNSLYGDFVDDFRGYDLILEDNSFTPDIISAGSTSVNFIESPLIVKSDFTGGLSSSYFGRTLSIYDPVSQVYRTSGYRSIQKVDFPSLNMPYISYAASGLTEHQSLSGAFIHLLDHGVDVFFERYFHYSVGDVVNVKNLASNYHRGEHLVYGTIKQSNGVSIPNIGFLILLDDAGNIIKEKLVELKDAWAVQFYDAIELRINNADYYYIVGAYYGDNGHFGLVYIIDDNGNYVDAIIYPLTATFKSITTNALSNPSSLVIAYEDYTNVLRQPGLIEIDLATMGMNLSYKYTQTTNGFTTVNKIIRRDQTASSSSPIEYYINCTMNNGLIGNIDGLVYRLNQNFLPAIGANYSKNVYFFGTSSNDYFGSMQIIDGENNDFSGLVNVGYTNHYGASNHWVAKSYFQGSIGCWDNAEAAIRTNVNIVFPESVLEIEYNNAVALPYYAEYIDHNLFHNICYTTSINPSFNERISQPIKQELQSEKTNNEIKQDTYFNFENELITIYNYLGMVVYQGREANVDLSKFTDKLLLIRWNEKVLKHMH